MGREKCLPYLGIGSHSVLFLQVWRPSYGILWILAGLTRCLRNRGMDPWRAVLRGSAKLCIFRRVPHFEGFLDFRSAPGAA